MPLTSRLELEVDSGSAEQKVIDMRKALDALDQAGLRINNTFNKSSSEFTNLALSLSKAQAANDKAAQASDKAAKSAEDQAKAAASQRKELDSLLGKIDPLTKKLNELAAQEAALAKARDSGQINTSAYDAYNNKIQESLNTLAGATAAQKQMGESAEQAKARLLALAKSATDTAAAQKSLTNTAVGLSEAEQGILVSSNAASSGQAKLSAASEKTAAAAKQAGLAAGAQADSLEDLLASIDPTTRALNKLDDQERRLAKQKKIGAIDADTFTKYQTVIDQTRSALTRFDDGMNRTGNTAKQTAAALRGVPAQFTDIFVSLQGGQAPLTVFLQQGGQLKDMFGGIGPAAKALGGYVLGLVNPLTVGAAAVGTLGLAYYQGSKDQAAFQSALLLTGNAAGTTSGNLAAAAQNVSKSVGTIGAASMVLAQLAASGKIPASSFESIAVAALKMEEATGKAAAQTVADFEKLAKDPVRYSKELNDSLNYLTASQYAQIDALVSQGKQQEAANLAEKTYADALSSRADNIKQNLGAIETAWNSVKSAAKGAWDAALDIGREDTFDQKMDKLKQRLADATNTVPTVFSDNPDLSTLGKGEKGLQAEITKTLQLYQDQTEAAWRANLAASKNQEGIAAVSNLNSALENTSSKQDKLAKRYKEIDAQVAAAAANGVTYSQDQIVQLRKAAEEQYKISKSAKAFQEDAGQKMLDDARQRYAVLVQQKTAIDMQGEGARNLGSEAKKLIELETEIANLKEKKTLTAAQKQVLAMADLNLAQQKQNAALEKANDLTKIRLDNAAKLLSFQEQLNDSLQLAQNGLDAQVAGLGMGQKERDRIQEDLRIRQDYQKQLAKLQRDYQNIVNPSSEQTDLYDKETAAVKAALNERLSAQQSYYQQIDQAQSNWVNGANAALQDYMDEAQDVSGQTYTLFSDSLHGIEDAFVGLATEGKLSFKSLADSIIADLARMAAKAYVVLPLLGALGLAGSSSASAGVASSFGSVGGGGAGGVGGLTSIWNTVSGAYSVGTSAFGSAIAAGYASGQGFLGGLQGAISGGTGYLSNAIGGLFSSGVQGGAGVMLDSAGNLVNAGVGSGATALGGTLAGVGGALYGYGQSGVKGAAAGAAGSVGGYYAGSALGSLVGPIGTVVGGVLGSALGGLLGGSLFGGSWQTKDQGISLGVAGGDLSALQFEYQKKKGGLFGSNKKRTRYSALDTDTEQALQESYESTTGAVFDLFDKLNVTLNDGVLDGLSIGATQISTKGKTAEQIQEEITKWFGTVADTVTSTINDAASAGLGGYTFQGLTDFVNNLYGVNDVFNTLNLSLYDSTVAGGKLAESLSVMAGGLANLQAAASTYYDNFYTDTEKANNVLDAVSKQFSGLDVDFPDSRQAFRDTVDGLDRTTEAGQQMFITLTSLAGSAASAYTILEQRAAEAAAVQQAALDAAQAANANYYTLFTTDAEKSADKLLGVREEFKALGVELPATRDAFMEMVYAAQQGSVAGKATASALLGLATDADAAYKIIQDSLMQGANNAFSTLQRSISAQQKAASDAYNARVASLNEMLSAANTSVSDLTSISTSLDNALKSLRGTSDEAVTMLRSQAQATLQNALATARAGGSLANFAGLDDALDTVTSNSTDLYSSLQDFNRDQGRTANVVAELNELNGKQLTTAEKTAKALQDQLDQAKDEYDLLSSQFDTQLAFAQSQLDALSGVDNSIMSVTDAINAMNIAVVAALGGQSKGAGQANSQQNNATLVNSIYQAVLGRNADAPGLAAWTGALANGATYQQVLEAIKASAAANGQLKVPGYASGGNFGGGIRLVGERGPEIELTGPSKILNASQTAQALRNSSSSSGSSDLAERQAWTNKLLNQVLNAINRQTTQGVPALPVT